MTTNRKKLNETLHQKRIEKIDKQADEANRIFKVSMLWLIASVGWYALSVVAIFTENDRAMLMTIASALVSFYLHRHYYKRAEKMMNEVIAEMDEVIHEKIQRLIREDPEAVLEIIRKGKKK